MKTSMIVRIGYNDVFNRAKTVTKEALAGQLHIESSLELMAVINKYEHTLRERDDAELKFILNDWLSGADGELRRKIFACFTRLAEKRSKTADRPDFRHVSVINRLSSLRTMELLIAESEKRPMALRDKGSTSGGQLLLLYLLVNDELASRQDKPFEKYLSTRKNKGHETRLHLYLGLSHADLTGEGPSKKLATASFTFILLEKWLKSNPTYAPISEHYLRSLGCSDWWELYTKIFNVNQVALEFHKIQSDHYPELIPLLDYFSNHTQSSTYWQEMAGLRKSPLYRCLTGDYLVLDFSFMLDKFFAGLYHDLVGVSAELPNNNFHQDYSKDFMENVLLCAALKACFGKSYVQHNEATILALNVKGTGSLGLPDYYVRNGNKVIHFECKNSYLSNAAKIAFDTDRIEKEIVEKFVGTTKKKAVRQLLAFIENSDAGKYAFFDNPKNAGRLVHFPVLIVTDPTLTSLAFNEILSEYMDGYKEGLPHGLAKRIRPLTIIHINDLLYYNIDLKKLDVIILSYHEFLSKAAMPDKMVSFTTYLDHHKFQGARNIPRRNISHIVGWGDEGLPGK